MTPPVPALQADGRAYVLDMIAELAKLARKLGEAQIAIHLEAILAAASASQRGRSTAY